MSEYPQWLNYDILVHILSYLKSDAREGHRQQGYSDILSMAKCCRGLLTPCLEVIWRKQESLLPVLKLIPQFKFDSHVKVWHLDDDVSPADWTRFDYYAGMIKEINLNDRDVHEEYIHHSVFCSLIVSRKAYVFPNLAVIKTTPNIRTTLFHSSAMTRVCLDTGNSSNDKDNLPWISSYVHRLQSPHLEDVSIIGITISRPILKLLLDIPKLQNISITTSLDAFLDGPIRHSPMLQSLSIAISSNYNINQPQQKKEQSSRHWHLVAPNLRSLVSNGEMNDVLAICQSIECKNLRDCQLEVYRGKRMPSVKREAAIYEKIGLQLLVLSSGDLESLQFYFPRDGVIPFQPMPFKAFEPLLNLHGLTMMIFDFTPFIADDSILRMMGESWPLIRKLSIPLSRNVTKPEATLRGLQALVELCPHLEELTATFDLTDPQSIPSSAGKQSRSTLRCLDVNHSFISSESVQPAINLLRDMCPNLETFKFDYSDFDFDSDDSDTGINSIVLWSRVEEGLKLKD